jgi:hypothetical protein
MRMGILHKRFANEASNVVHLDVPANSRDIASAPRPAPVLVDEDHAGGFEGAIIAIVVDFRFPQRVQVSPPYEKSGCFLKLAVSSRISSRVTPPTSSKMQ